MSEIDFSKLAMPFPEKDIEWRLQSCGKTKAGKIWGKALAYVTNRAIQQRLDDVVGPENWKNEFIAGPNGGILCGLSIRCNGEWITKYDGAENTQIEAVKGGLSDSMKRSAVQWAMGRYLYNLEEGWVEVTESGIYSGRTKEKEDFKWNPPKLPDWALPKDSSKNQTKDEPKNYVSKAPPKVQKASTGVTTSPSVAPADDPEVAKAIQTVESYLTSGKITKGIDRAKDYIAQKNLEGLNKVIAYVKEQDAIDQSFSA